MNEEPAMTEFIVGGNVFEFSTEVANLKTKGALPRRVMYSLDLVLLTYDCVALTTAADPGKFGIGYFQPDDCDHDATACEYKEYPEFANLVTAYTTTVTANLTKDAFTPSRDNILDCPKNATWSTDLPKMPSGTNCLNPFDGILVGC